jgi:photosystem II stability/assembly factor-like uncharacterized protein
MNDSNRSTVRRCIFAAAVLMCSGATAASAGASHSSVESHASGTPSLVPQASGTINRLQAVSPVNSNVVWASGVGGTYVVTTNGGHSWRAGVVPGAETLQFRDVQGVSERIAYLLAAGSGSNSHIYKTEDGGATWKLQFQAPDDPNYFYDCFSFWTPTRGITMADGINLTGRFPAVRTTNGNTWKHVDLPAAQKDEGAFAASGTCVATQGEESAWVVTTNSRVFATRDGGDTWAAYLAPIAGGTGSGGVFTVAFRDGRHGMVGGGDFASAATLDNVARSSDGGKTWRLTAKAPVPGAVFGLAYAQRSDAGDGEGDDEDYDGENSHRSHKKVLVTGPGGAAWTPDEGDTWNSLAGVTGFWAVAFANEHDGWLVGTNGRILKINF